MKNFDLNIVNLCLILTQADKLNLNLLSVNKVIIFDFEFNLILKEQAVEWAYCINQKNQSLFTIS